MATINIRGELFTSIYDNIRVRWGLPRGEHSRVMREAAIHVVSKDAMKRGHTPQIQGLSLECSKCGMSCAIHPPEGIEENWRVLGALSRDRCV